MRAQSKSNFKGAWLTDIDDTLIPSGHKPDDEWIRSLAKFIAVLKKHNIVWAPVSGVALEKMGPRLLYRLPAAVLSHVIYYGGEGSTKSLFDSTTQQWVSPEKYQRLFTDEQALVVIGKKHFSAALNNSCETNTSDTQRITERIKRAEKSLQGTRYEKIPSLVDELEGKLKEDGFDPNIAETYFRGGAVSWMMLGDISVTHYKGERETATREKLTTFLRRRLEELDYLQDIGETGIHMPYPHATRGIKLVLMGNDKGRAAEDLIQKENIPLDSLLFVGNELYKGGNDNSVRRIDGITMLSVGEKEDAGVINGGIQVDANWQWMEWVTTNLNQNTPWPLVLKNLPESADVRQLKSRIEQENENAHLTSDWHHAMSQVIPAALIAENYNEIREAFSATRKQLIKLKIIQYDLVARLAVLEQFHYDNARRIVLELFNDNGSTKQDKLLLSGRLKQYLFPELKMLLRQFFVDQLNIKEKKVRHQLNDVLGIQGLDNAIIKILELSDTQTNKTELASAKNIIKRWETKIEKLVESYFCRADKWRVKQHNEQAIITSLASKQKSTLTIQGKDLYRYLKWLIPRLEDIPHLKDLDKPTIVLLAGTSGVGKSTLSRHISKTMGIPTSFSSDVASRSVIRESISFLLGSDRAREIFPEVFGSSFAENSLEWFYAHSLMTMVGVVGNINRLIKENISAVIDGVALIPGTLPEEYFEKANIVWIVASVGDMNAHFERLGTRSETGVERGGADRYREMFSAIRNNHDRLVEMAQRTDSFTIDNSGQLESAMKNVIQRVSDPFADRGLLADDKIRDKIKSQLQERTTWEIQNAVLGKVQ
ncbi:MAG TPA: hypothetical protein EYH06_11685 [Chromatiales bacterium]|nr:hypothetical protein [Thiotrichales bacterium]HIP69223.1 hypothetical protein [Chromatiales bacterium]